MRGKSPDHKFISQYLERCISDHSCQTVEQMLNFVSEELQSIDTKLIEAENLKKLRPKLLDVKEFLNKKI